MLRSTGLTDRQKAIVGSTWLHRAREEEKASLRYDALALSLEKHHAPNEIFELCLRAARDEAEHAKLCMELAHEFLGQRADQATQADEVPAMTADYSEQQLTCEIVQTCCLNETWNATLLGHIYQQAEWPSIKSAARQLLADEIWHSRLGWSYLNALSSKGSLNWLSDHIVPMLKSSGAEEILRDKTGDELEAYGEVSGATRRQLFSNTFRDVISPGLETLGVSTSDAHAWLQIIGDRTDRA